MDSKIKTQNSIIIDQAWNNLNRRLENEGLLQDNDAKQKLTQNLYYRKFYVAAVFTACIIAGWYFTQKTGLPDYKMLELHNEVNAPTLATILEDGSAVYLSGLTSLKYPEHFDSDKREVNLQGDAFFDIKKQSGRPFIVETALAKVEVKGTSFSIKSDNKSSFSLSVLNGNVQVIRKSDQQAIPVNAGETVLFDSGQIRIIKNTTQFDGYFKRIHFKDEYLKNVANIINMHSGSIILKVDSEVEMRSITFPFSTDSDIIDIAKVICQAMELQYHQQENTVFISKQK